MKRYRILSVLMAVLALTSCLNEHPKDQLDEDAIYGSASEIYTNAVASLYNYIGGANESEGIQGTCRGIYDYNISDGSNTSSNWDYYWTATVDDADSSKAYYASVTTNYNGSYAGNVVSTKSKGDSLKAIGVSHIE